MSKAFTREDNLPESLVTRRATSTLPPGAKNYLTPDGADRLRSELDELLSARTRAAAEGTSGRERVQALDQRIQHLRQCLVTAVIVEPPVSSDDRVRFGATVGVRDTEGEVSSYRLVGVDEIDIDRNWVSWLSPIGKSLLNAKRGERVRFRFPSGEKELEITEISYDAPPRV
jgi:transcription elongation factor GreB